MSEEKSHLSVQTRYRIAPEAEDRTPQGAMIRPEKQKKTGNAHPVIGA